MFGTTSSRLFCHVYCSCFFFNDTATTEIYTLHIVGSVRCVQETGYQRRVHGQFAGPLPGSKQGNPRRIRHNARCDYPVFCPCKGQVLDFATHEMGEGICIGHCRFRQEREGFLEQFAHSVILF
eukprot:TRINITY_DN26817_c0_g1_i1.p5 TRINITY_DN26817_c0_g1~~TRINITY_DN26817_c0_g1_i1.p5  ORF type:complete len:124 (+),score=13.08 TRINITY_DN26817_c0_g1_i1:33-404(+)